MLPHNVESYRRRIIELSFKRDDLEEEVTDLKKQLIIKEKKLNFERLFLTVFFVMLFTGGILNTLPLIHNGGRMPVYTSILFEDDSRHFRFENKEEVKYWALSDIFYMDLRKYNLWFSIGDVIIILGGIYAIIIAIYYTKEVIKNKKNKKKREIR